MTIKNRLFWIAAFVAIVFDQITKYWTVQSFELGESLPLWEGVFHFTYVLNTGAAFSLFSNGGSWLRWLSLLVSLGLMALAFFGPPMNRWEQVGFGCILGGALGNGIDRFASGAVVDFLDFRLIQFPIFNLADVAINIGIICLLIAAFRQPPSSGNIPKRPRS
ncbi:MAG: signal peptidase II [Synechococcales bacterium]|nr:signal peptidase II [Synechococcales bacterium]